MSAPPLTHTGQALYEALAPLATEDAGTGYQLADFMSALALPLDLFSDLSRDRDDGTEGWGVLWQTDRIPAVLLDYSAMFRGIVYPRYADDAFKRQQLSDDGGFQRCGPEAVLAAARRHLTGTRTVFLTERDGSARHLTVTTWASETPDRDAVLRAILTEKPAGHRFTHRVATGGDFQTVTATHSNFAALTATFSTFDELRANPAKQ